MTMEYCACELRDVGEHCSILLPHDSTTGTVWVIGLTLTSELSSCLAESVLDSDVIVTLFYVQRRSDGHWATPHSDLPLVLNDESLETPMLLSHGSVLMVGGHTFTYLIREDPTTELPEDSPTSPAHPPPKPKRNQRGSVLKEDVLSRSQKFMLLHSDTMTSVVAIDIDMKPKESEKLTIVFDKDKQEPDIEKSTEIFLSIRDSVVNNDLELLEHIHTPEQMVNVCASYLLQFCVGSGLTLNTRDMDSAYQAMTVVCLHQPGFYFDFLSSMKKSQVITEHDIEPFLLLFNHMLLICMDSLDSSLVCLKILTHFSQDPQHLPALIRHKTQSLVCACMSVYPDHLHIQILSCQFMENVSHNWGAESGHACPVREAGLDLLVRAVIRHGAEKPLLRPALMALVNVLRAHAQRGRADSHVSGGTEDSGSTARSDTVVEFLASKALPAVMDVHGACADDREIRELCQEMMDYYAEQDSVDQYASFHNMQTQAYLHNAETALSQVHTSDSGSGGVAISVYDELQFSQAQQSDEETSSASGYKEMSTGIPPESKTAKEKQPTPSPHEIKQITKLPLDINPQNETQETISKKPSHAEPQKEATTQTGRLPSAKDKTHGKATVSDEELDSLYAKVNKPKHKSLDLSESYKQSDMVDNDLYGNVANASLESEEEEGPELDYETRDFLNSTEIGQSKAATNGTKSPKDKSDEHLIQQTRIVDDQVNTDFRLMDSLTNTNIKPPSLHSISLEEDTEFAKRKSSDSSIEIITEEELKDNVPRDWKTVKMKGHNPQDIDDASKVQPKLTRKLGKYFRKLKPKKKQKFHVPHDMDASQTYVAFETCDSDFDVIDGESGRANMPKSTTNDTRSTTQSLCVLTNESRSENTLRSEQNTAYEDALPVRGLPGFDTSGAEDFNDDYEDIRNFERSSSLMAESGNITDDGNLIYDLAGPCSWDDATQSSVSGHTEHKTVSKENETKTIDEPLHNSVPEAKPNKDITEKRSNMISSNENINGNRRRQAHSELCAVSKSSNDSLDSYIPSVNDWDKVSQTSEDEFINDATQGMFLHAQPQHGENGGYYPNERLVGELLVDGNVDSVSLYSERSIDSRISQVIPEDSEAVFDENHELDSRWSPQVSVQDYKTMKRVKDKTKSKKSNWVSALKQIYEKPQKKLSKSHTWKSNSCTNLSTSNKQILENPIYGGTNLYKSPSTQSLDESGKKSRKKFRWGRKKSKDVVALPTSPSTDMIPEEGEDGLQESHPRSQRGTDSDNAFTRNEFQTVRGKQKNHQKYPWHSAKKK